MLRGDDAVRRLGELARGDDAAASSHWRQQHEGFHYEDGRLSGLRGFGGALARTLPRSLFHRALQIPFRRMGAELREFPACDRLAAGIARRQERAYDLDVLRQALTLALLAEKLPAGFEREPLMLIGDGFGMMSALLLSRWPVAKVFVVNLTKTLLVDMIYLRRALPGVGTVLAESADDARAALADPDARIIAVRAEDSGILRGLPVGLAINIASMQEMDPPTVAAYFDLLRAAPNRETWFYCCNRTEKTLPDGTLVAFGRYPWNPGDRVVVDGLCPWHQRWYRPWPPFYRAYDGPIRHRLAALVKADRGIS